MLHAFIAIWILATILLTPLRSEAIMIFDNYDAWAAEMRQPIVGACATSQSCFPDTFGLAKGVGAGSLNDLGTGAITLPDADWAYFEKNPVINGIGFRGTGRENDTWGLAIPGLGIGITYFFVKTDFLGVIGNGDWALGTIIGTPRDSTRITEIYFNASAAPGFVSTLQTPEPSSLMSMLLGLVCVTLLAWKWRGRLTHSVV